MDKISYKRPPITEAVIGINFQTPIDSEILTSVSKKFSSHYPQNQDISNFDISLEISEATPEPVTQLKKVQGYRLSNHDMTQLLVLWPNAFFTSQLAPYTGWDDFFARFERDWKIWKRHIGFNTISRIGVRYINRIDVPQERKIILEDYLNIFPTVPEFLGSINAYGVQVNTALADIKCNLLLNSGAVPSPIFGTQSFLVDIDISQDAPPQSDNDIFELLRLIRDRKNSLFEACVTDKARELFS